MENVYIIGSQAAKECIVVDPGAQAERIVYEVQRLGLTAKLIVNTHGHGDHTSAVAGVKAATGAVYAIHQADLPLLKESEWARQAVADYQPPPAPDRYLAEGDALEVGGLRFQVLETPGHTPGGICLYGHGLALTGDTLFQGSIGRYDLPGGDGRQLLLSIFGKLLTLPEETVVYPGHGNQTTIGREKQGNPFLRGAPGL
ncbi:MAG: MBL fold metallo-hydrolase [Chloroflexi bacterium]|nr:MBL fold metallo-hydrolase [Chloroflexota bacterium]